MSPHTPLTHSAWEYDPSGSFSGCFKILSVLAEVLKYCVLGTAQCLLPCVMSHHCHMILTPSHQVVAAQGPTQAGKAGSCTDSQQSEFVPPSPCIPPTEAKCKYVFKKTNCRDLAEDQVSCLCHCVSSCRAYGSITKTTTFQRRSSRFPWRAQRQPDPAASKVCLALDKHLLPHTALISFSKALITGAKRLHD